jgi:hypothetical protein
MRRSNLGSSLAGLTIISGFGHRFEEVIFQGEQSAMTDEHLRRAPSPNLRTRPATMLTAIGLCLLIIVMQLAPDLQALSSRFTTAASASTSISR